MDGPDKPSHDDGETFSAILQVPDLAVVSEMREPDRNKPGYDGEGDDLASPGHLSGSPGESLPQRSGDRLNAALEDRQVVPAILVLLDQAAAGPDNPILNHEV